MRMQQSLLLILGVLLAVPASAAPLRPITNLEDINVRQESYQSSTPRNPRSPEGTRQPHPLSPSPTNPSVPRVFDQEVSQEVSWYPPAEDCIAVGGQVTQSGHCRLN